MYEDAHSAPISPHSIHRCMEIHRKVASQPDGLAVLDCPSETERRRMTADWTTDDWYGCLLDVSLNYEDEMRATSVRTIGDLLGFPLGCLLGMMASWVLWGRSFGLYLPLVGPTTSEVSILVFFSATLLSCSIEPFVALADYGKADISDGIFAAFCPGMICGCMAKQAAPASRALAVTSMSVAIVRALLITVRTISEDASNPLPSIVYVLGCQLKTLAVVLHAVMLLSVTGTIPAGCSATQRIGVDTIGGVTQVAGDSHSIETHDLQDVLDDHQLAVAVRRTSSGSNMHSAARWSTGRENGFQHDIQKVPIGTPVYAIADGTITCQQKYTASGGTRYLVSYGNVINFSSSDGKTKAIYAHLNGFEGCGQIIPSSSTKQLSASECNVSTINCGSRQVKRGELIGYVGTTGNSSGTHLHLELRINGSRINPPSYVGIN